mgnify:CR=1 FL=1
MQTIWAQPERSADTRPGFTMIELIVVIAIIAIAAVVVVPQIGRTDTFEVQGAARALISDLLYAQNDAIGEQATRRVIFNTTNNSYRLTDGSNVTLPAQWLGGSYQVDLADSFSQVSIDSVSFTSATMSFDELGSPSEGGTIDLTAGGQRYRITVTAFTGRVTVDQVTGG